MKIAPRWDAHSVPLCAPTCSAYVPCLYAAHGHVCIPAVRAMASLLRPGGTPAYASKRCLQREVEAEHELHGGEP